MNRTAFLAFASALSFAGASPLTAQAPPAAPQQPAAASSPVDSFYAAQGNAPIWLKDVVTRAVAQKLPAILRQAELDGLADGPALAAEVEAALGRGQLADDKLISAAWVRYVQALNAPVRGMSYGDPALAPSARSDVAILKDAARAPSLGAHVDEVAAVNPFYSALREQALKAGAAADPRVRASLERLRIIPAKGRAIVVDAAGAQLWMLEDGRPVDSMKVIVGRRKSPTPLLAGTIHYITYNPYWNIPHDVARDTVAPLVVKRGVSYLKAARYVTADGFGQKAGLVDPSTIDWKGVASGEAPVYLRQLPGENNMMGSMKFGFVNDYDIFLHDTPRKQLFAKEQRTLSMGCIRLEHADRLARWLLGRVPELESDRPEQHVQLDKGVPIYVTYLTAIARDGQLAFAKDVYGLDPAPETQQVASASPPESGSAVTDKGGN
jgi:L,D-transpeptidase YcbB